MTRPIAGKDVTFQVAHIGAISLNSCWGRHHSTMRVCDPAVVACHDDFCPGDEDGALNPVLSHMSALRGTTLEASVDMTIVDSLYLPGERTIHLHSNRELFNDSDGRPVELFTVTEAAHDESYIGAYITERAARARFERATQP